MNKKIIFVADFFANQIPGGGELNNDEFIKLVLSRNVDIRPAKSEIVNVEFLKQNKDHTFVIGNFINLNSSSVEYLIGEGLNYSIYEHDHKYLTTRDPSKFPEYVAPEEYLCNLDFYRNARAVFCQSDLHKKVVKKNLKTRNIHNLGGNLWDLKTLDLLEEISKKSKRDKIAIWDSFNPIKNTSQTVAYCKLKGFEYDLVGNLPYDSFLEKLGENKTFLFMPETLETLCRVVVEARMMNMRTITNGKIGASSEEWFSLKGKDLINEMRNKRETIPSKILGEIF